MVLTKCCFCIDLRVGAIIIALLEMVAAIGCIIVSSPFPWYVIMFEVCGLIAGGCLLVGAISYHKIATTINLVLTTMSMVFYVIAGIVLFVVTTGSHDPIGRSFNYVGALFIILALINIYFWLCVFSFLRGLKSGTSHVSLVSI